MAIATCQILPESTPDYAYLPLSILLTDRRIQPSCSRAGDLPCFPRPYSGRLKVFGFGLLAGRLVSKLEEEFQVSTIIKAVKSHLVLLNHAYSNVVYLDC